MELYKLRIIEAHAGCTSYFLLALHAQLIPLPVKQ